MFFGWDFLKIFPENPSFCPRTVDKLLPPNVKGESSEFEIFRFLEVDVPSGKQNEEVHP